MAKALMYGTGTTLFMWALTVFDINFFPIALSFGVVATVIMYLLVRGEN
jgi:hypothetical protein